MVIPLVEIENPFLNDKYKTLPNSKSLQATITNLTKMADSCPQIGRKHCGEKGEIAREEQFLFLQQCFQKTRNADT